jgi:hypothetical protein
MILIFYFNIFLCVMKLVGVVIFPSYLYLMKSLVCTINYKFCDSSPTYLQTCNYRMYYVVHKFPNLSRATIHLGTHSHPVTKGMCRKSFHEMKNMVVYEVCRSQLLHLWLLLCLWVKVFFCVTCSTRMGKVLWSSSKVKN